MHTHATDDGWRIHHHGGFHGDVLVVFRRDETSWDEFRTTSGHVLDLLRTHHHVAEMVLDFPAATNDGRPTRLCLPLSVLRDFVAHRYVLPRLLEWLDEAEATDLLKLLPFVLALDPPEEDSDMHPDDEPRDHDALSCPQCRAAALACGQLGDLAFALEQAILNGTLQRLGAAAARRREAAFWEAFLDDPAHGPD